MIDPEDIDMALGTIDPEAMELVDRMLTEVERITDRHFRQVTLFTERLDGGVQDIYLRERPVQSDDADLVTVEQWSGSAWTAVDEDDYVLVRFDKPNYEALLQHDSLWPTGRRNIRVTYYAGYEFGALPQDIVQLVLDLAKQRWLDRGSENLKSETIGGYSYTRFDGGVGSSVRLADDPRVSLWRRVVLA